MPYADPEQHRAYMREWKAKRRAEFFAGKACVRCGSTDRLELDHVDPTKKVSHKIWTWSLERRDAELAKCQILCHEHHLEKTRLDGEPPHGTHSRYVHRGCRCGACRAAHAAQNAQYR